MLRPASLLDLDAVPQGGVAGGNLRATVTLLVLLALTTLLVAAIVVWPLVRTGRPPGLSHTDFGLALVYFGLIGAGFMLVQIPFLQRFSVYLGHPTWTLAVILFGMILCTGIGSAISDRIPTSARWLPVAPVAVALVLVADTALIQPVVDATAAWSLAGRTSWCWPCSPRSRSCSGSRFRSGCVWSGQASDLATAWLWGVNGACGVLASVGAVAISMWFGIHRNLWLAAVDLSRGGGDVAHDAAASRLRPEPIRDVGPRGRCDDTIAPDDDRWGHRMGPPDAMANQCRVCGGSGRRLVRHLSRAPSDRARVSTRRHLDPPAVCAEHRGRARGFPSTRAFRARARRAPCGPCCWRFRWPLGVSALISAKVLGVGLVAVAALAAAALARRLSGDAWAGMVAGMAVALTPRMVWAGLSGMEAPLYTALVTLAMLAYVRALQNPAADRGLWALCAGLAGWARPEAFVAAAILGVACDG